MEVTLIVVTLLSIALAIAMGILTWRLLQEERMRSDARVAALEQGLAETLQDAYVTQAAKSPAPASKAAAANADTLPLVASSSVASSSAASSSAASSPAMLSTAAASTSAAESDLFRRDDTDWLAHFPASTVKPPAAASRAAERPFETSTFAADAGDSAADADDTLYAGDRLHAARTHAFNGAHAARTATAADGAFAADDLATDDLATNDVAANTVVNANGGLFGQIEAHDERVGWSRHVLAVAAVAAVMIGAVIAFWTIGRLMEPAADRAGTTVARAGAGANGAATSALELMSLRQEMQDGTLTISGLVRNPRSGVPQERLTAVVFFFDGQGGFLSSTRAPLDYRALAPGEESPFQLSAPAPPGVARYRVSFRRDEGAVVPHVDRRQQVQQSLHDKPDQHSDAALYGQPRHSQPRHGLTSDGQRQQQEASRS